MPTANQPVQLGSVQATLGPHHLAGVGALVFLVLDEPGTHCLFNLTAERARLLADALKIAACQAEAIARRAERRKPCLNRAA